MGTTELRRAIALAAFVSLAVWECHASAATDATVIADAVRNLDADHDEATAAVYLLQAGGAEAARQIRAAWPSLGLLGQKRALGAIAELADEHEAALDVWLAAARSEDEDLRDRAFALLRRIQPRGREGLVVLLPDPRVGDRAASVLARIEPRLAVEPILAAMSEPGGAERAGLRHALAVAVQRADSNVEPQLLSWLVTEPDAAAVASAAMGLQPLGAYEELIARYIEYAAPKLRDFPSEWRLLRGALAAGSSDEVDRWVRSQLDSSTEWMLRRAAVNVMVARGHRAVVRPALSDPYPRVRARAAAALSNDSESMIERATLARRDTWPMVRAQAVTSLRTETDALPVVVASVDDSMSLVRTAAIEVLATSSSDAGWDRVQRRLRDPNEWPEVTAAAIGYVVAHCRTDAVDSLLQVVIRAAPSHALTEDLNNAARAIEALQSLASPESRSAIELLRNMERVPPTLKMALEQPPAEDGGCSAHGR